MSLRQCTDTSLIYSLQVCTGARAIAYSVCVCPCCVYVCLHACMHACVCTWRRCLCYPRVSMRERKRGTERSRDAACSVYSPSPGRFDRNTERMTQSLDSPDISRRFRSTLVFPANLPSLLPTTSAPVADVLWTGAPIHRFW